ncbi:MAG: efflux RND transporter periplasmic adaptor subunit [Bacteroidetes bacterium]|nr:MAG: efflux RND transporter periplasmic adaptor subunit [Bacteroidota bacterium]
MNMKQSGNRDFIIIIFLFVILACIACNNKKENHSAHQNPVMPSAVNELPGKAVVSSQRTVRPIIDSINTTKNINGYIVPDERRTNKIISRIGGRIEKIHVKYIYQWVNKGQQLLELYSPEISKYLEEYLYLAKQNETSLLIKAKEKLLLLGLTENQISAIEKSGKVPHTLSVYAPQSGYILPADETNERLNKMSPTSPVAGGMGNMPSTNQDDRVAVNNRLREGMYINKDQVLFTINDLQKVWGIMMGSVEELSTVKQGDAAILKGIGNKQIKAKADFVEPFFDKGQKFTRIRLYVDNADNVLRLNSIIEAEINIQGKPLMTIPASSVIDLGQRKIVWIKTGNSGKNNIFSAREIKPGGKVNNKIVVLGGITGTDEIAEQAGYIIDSETLLK